MAASSSSAAAPAATGGAGPGTPSASASSDVIATTKPSAPSSSSSKRATPQAEDQPVALPHRDKDSFHKLMLHRYIEHDMIGSYALKASQDQMQEDLRRMREKVNDYRNVRTQYKPLFPPARLYGEGYNGYGNGHTEIGGLSKILYPANKPRPGKRSTPPLKWTRKDMKKQAEQHEELVPVRLDVDWDKIKLRDTFTWNLHDRLVHPELFAMQLVEDMGLRPPVAQQIIDQVLSQLHEQLNDFYPFVFSEEDALDPELPYSAYKNDEMRVLIKLNITIGPHTLVDQFEWEINDPLNSPEDFAACMAKDLSLSGEFATAIAHCIREQTQLFTRSLYGVGHPFDGRPVEDPDLTTAFLPSPLPTVFRPQQQAKEYAPYLYEMSEADLERNETILSREQRRQKRSVNRRGGPQLPDLKERQRTVRTLIVSSVLPGAATSVDESRLYKRTGATAPGGRGRRNLRDGEVSDSEESEDSAPDSPAMSQLQGTARTRGLRGAASVAAQRMANVGRSETPEATIHHHETRTSRRFGRELTREDTEGPESYMVTLRVGPAKLRKLLRELKTKPATPSGSATPSAPAHLKAPGTAAQMGPPSTPSASVQATPSKATTPAGQLGRVPAPPPPAPGEPTPPPPPTPEWLSSALQKLRKQWPNDSFEGVMRYCAISKETDQPVPQPPPGQPIPPDIQFMYVPRIRCHDCPGKLYTPGPDTTVINFEVHLKNRGHREKVDARLKSKSRSASASSTPGATPAAGGSAAAPPGAAGRSSSAGATPAAAATAAAAPPQPGGAS